MSKTTTSASIFFAVFLAFAPLAMAAPCPSLPASQEEAAARALPGTCLADTCWQIYEQCEGAGNPEECRNQFNKCYRICATSPLAPEETPEDPYCTLPGPHGHSRTVLKLEISAVWGVRRAKGEQDAQTRILVDGALVSVQTDAATARRLCGFGG